MRLPVVDQRPVAMMVRASALFDMTRSGKRNGGAGAAARSRSMTERRATLRRVATACRAQRQTRNGNRERTTNVRACARRSSRLGFPHKPFRNWKCAVAAVSSKVELITLAFTGDAACQ